MHIPDEAHQKRLVEKLCALHHRDSVLLDIRTDPELVGGFVLTIDGVTYDRSVRGALRDMGNNTVRCIMLSPSEGLGRGVEVLHTGGPISVPVGDGILGRMARVRIFRISRQ